MGTLHGNAIKVGDFKGNALLLDFWATWSAPCQRELAILQEVANEFPEDVSLLTVTSEDKNTVASFIEKSGSHLPIAFDPGSACANRYGVSAIPHLVLIDKHGVVRNVFVGLEGNLFR